MKENEFIVLLCSSFQPVVLGYLIEQFSYTEDDRTVEMYASASVMIGMSAIMIFLTHHSSFGLTRAGMKIRIAVSSLVYRKVRTKLVKENKKGAFKKKNKSNMYVN